MMSKFVGLLLGAAGLAAAAGASHAASSGPLAPGCYAVVDPKDKVDLDNAQEVVCVDASGHAVVRESSFFGDGIKGCNVVTTTAQGDKIVVDVDYRKCTNNSPSHQLVCRADGAAGFACVMKMGGGKDDEMQVKLAPLPPG